MSIDVNDQFASEKADQIDAARNEARRFQERLDKAEITDIGGGQYRVNTGWDRGEVFTATRNQLGEIEQVIANHGLDTAANGEVALYTRKPAWHKLGQVVPQGVSDIDEVLRLAHLDWDVTKVPATYTWGEETLTNPDMFQIIRADSGAPLGIAGTGWTPIQNRQAFEFLQELVADNTVLFETAGSMRGGRKTFVSIRLPQTVVIDAEGVNDEVVPYIVVSNAHTGHDAAQAVVTPWRPVCANTERFALRDAHTRWTIRHTRGAHEKIAEARKTMGLSLRYYERFGVEETQLARTDVTIDEVRALIDALWEPPEPDASQAAKTIARKRTDRLMDMFGEESKRLGRTAYAAERTVTDYLDHVAPRRPGKSMTEEIARATALIEGNDDELKSKAHRNLLLLRR
jgi:phage/plasmid-like protein (TIGR03299 family)